MHLIRTSRLHSLVAAVALLLVPSVRAAEAEPAARCPEALLEAPAVVEYWSPAEQVLRFRVKGADGVQLYLLVEPDAYFLYRDGELGTVPVPAPPSRRRQPTRLDPELQYAPFMHRVLEDVGNGRSVIPAGRYRVRITFAVTDHPKKHEPWCMVDSGPIEVKNDSPFVSIR